MTNLKVSLQRIFAIAIIAAFFASCTQESTEVTTDQISEENLAKIENLGFDTDYAIKKDQYNPLTKETISGYMLDEDIFISLEQLDEMSPGATIHTTPEGEQYRTTNLVSPTNRTISVIGYTGSGYALTSVMQTGLERAINNFNAVNMGLNFTLAFGTNYTQYDITVYNGGGSSAGGSAGFPFSNGDPYNFVQILGGLNSYNADVNEHVITHEIGHCIGFRHTDYFNRSISCGGSPVNEGSSGVGAIHVPGTPTGADLNSIMLSCFNSSVNGEFSADDIDALEYLY